MNLTPSRFRFRLAALAAFCLAAAACAQGDAMASDDLSRELESAAGETGLLPAGGGTNVVSAIEQTAPRGDQVRPVASRSGEARARRATTPAVQIVAEPDAAESAPIVSGEPAATVEAASPEPSASPATGTAREAGAGSPSPLPIPVPNGRRRGGSGGVWTTEDVIRNAPFPIKP